MGVKGEAGGVSTDSSVNEEQLRKQQELFNQLDKEYMMARLTTHTHRGIGLGAISLGPTSTATTSQPVPPKSDATPQ